MRVRETCATGSMNSSPDALWRPSPRDSWGPFLKRSKCSPPRTVLCANDRAHNRAKVAALTMSDRLIKTRLGAKLRNKRHDHRAYKIFCFYDLAHSILGKFSPVIKNGEKRRANANFMLPISIKFYWAEFVDSRWEENFNKIFPQIRPSRHLQKTKKF